MNGLNIQMVALSRKNADPIIPVKNILNKKNDFNITNQFVFLILNKFI